MQAENPAPPLRGGLGGVSPQVGDNIITTVKGNRRRGCEGKQTDGRKHLHFLFFNKLE